MERRYNTKLTDLGLDNKQTSIVLFRIITYKTITTYQRSFVISTENNETDDTDFYTIPICICYRQCTKLKAQYLCGLPDAMLYKLRKRANHIC